MGVSCKAAVLLWCTQNFKVQVEDAKFLEFSGCWKGQGMRRGSGVGFEGVSVNPETCPRGNAFCPKKLRIEWRKVLCLCFCLSVSLSLCLTIPVSDCVSVCPSVCLSTFLSICLSGICVSHSLSPLPRLSLFCL